MLSLSLSLFLSLSRASQKGAEAEEDEEDEDSEAEGDEGEEDALIKKEKKPEKKVKKPENVLDVLRELVGLPVSRDDAHWFDCVRGFVHFVIFTFPTGKHVSSLLPLSPIGNYGCRIR